MLVGHFHKGRGHQEHRHSRKPCLPLMFLRLKDKDRKNLMTILHPYLRSITEPAWLYCKDLVSPFQARGWLAFFFFLRKQTCIQTQMHTLKYVYLMI